MNVLVLTGSICKDINLETSENGKNFLRNTIAVSRDYRNSEGNYETDFFNFVVFNGTAEYLNEKAKKGDHIEIVGSLKYNKRMNNEGNPVVTYDIVVKSIALLPRVPKSSNETYNFEG